MLAVHNGDPVYDSTAKVEELKTVQEFDKVTRANGKFGAAILFYKEN